MAYVILPKNLFHDDVVIVDGDKKISIDSYDFVEFLDQEGILYEHRDEWHPTHEHTTKSFMRSEQAVRKLIDEDRLIEVFLIASKE